MALRPPEVAETALTLKNVLREYLQNKTDAAVVTIKYG